MENITFEDDSAAQRKEARVAEQAALQQDDLTHKPAASVELFREPQEIEGNLKTAVCEDEAQESDPASAPMQPQTDSVNKKSPEISGEIDATTGNTTDVDGKKARALLQQVEGTLRDPQHPEPPLQGLGDDALTLLEDAVQGLRRISRGYLCDGDVLIVLDVEDPSGVFRVQSIDMGRCSARFKDMLAEISPGPVAVEGVKYLFVLQGVEDGVPMLSRKPLSTTRQSYLSERQSLREVVPRSEPSTQKSVRVKIEQEFGSDHGQSQNDHRDWTSAYESFLCMSSHEDPKINTEDLPAAIPLIEAVSRLAHHYEATSRLSNVRTIMTTLFTEWIDREQLLSAIVQDPARWLLIGNNLRNASVYREALIHIVGNDSAWKSSIEEHDLPPDIIARIRERKKEHRYWRMSVDQRLLTMGCVMDETKPLKTKAGDGLYPNTDKYGWLVCNYFLDWIRSHIRLLEASGNTNTNECTTGAFCDHAGGKCLQLAGFYRLLSSGGDKYLPEKQMLKAVENLGGFRMVDKQEACRYYLKELKIKASDIVKDLTSSTSKFEGKDALPYLTSVNTVDAEDMPWLAPRVE
jgi:hypothetical protein